MQPDLVKYRHQNFIYLLNVWKSIGVDYSFATLYVRFAEEVIGKGIGRKRREAHHYVAMKSLMNLAASLESFSEPTHPCRALCRAATENANSDSDLEVVAENISVNHNHLCLGYSYSCMDTVAT
nr:hypothetical protein [Tanacetum cinerariifolium]